MVKLTVDKSFREQLDRVHEQAQLCDEAGKTLGYFLPESLHRRLLYDWANSQVTDEELESARNEPGGSTLAEIWERLRHS